MDRDEAFYERVAAEVANGEIRPGLWAKAIAQSNGSKDLARSRYIQLRVQQLQEASSTEMLQRKRERWHRRMWDAGRASWQFVKSFPLLGCGIISFLLACGCLSFAVYFLFLAFERKGEGLMYLALTYFICALLGSVGSYICFRRVS